jgi:hypothetical protein
MTTSRVIVGVVALGILAIGLTALGLVSPADSSDAQSGTMHNCPAAGKWSIAVWEGASGTAAADALATCGNDAVAAAYSLDSATGGWSRWFAGKPDVSNLSPLGNLQGVLALGAATPTPTPTATATPPTPAVHNGELRLGDTATVGDVRVTPTSVTYGLSECKQLLGLSYPMIITVPAGHEIVCLEWDEDDRAVDTETPTATPGKRDEFKVVDSAGDEEEMGAAQFGLNEDGSVHFKGLFAYPQGRHVVAFIYRNLWASEEARWSLE